jgi:2-iminoacetate synthase
MLMSTREAPGYRDELFALGISQISAGSCVGVGGYKEDTCTTCEKENTAQFKVADDRTPDELIRSLCDSGYIPSYCTACYRSGRTGDRFMPLAKSGQIGNVCQPNAILTLQEYMEDYGDDELRELGNQMIKRELDSIPNPGTRKKAEEYLDRIRAGERDLRF